MFCDIFTRQVQSYNRRRIRIWIVFLTREGQFELNVNCVVSSFARAGVEEKSHEALTIFEIKMKVTAQEGFQLIVELSAY